MLCRAIYLGTQFLKNLRLSPWRRNLHTKWSREGNEMWGRGPTQRKQIFKNNKYLYIWPSRANKLSLLAGFTVHNELTGKSESSDKLLKGIKLWTRVKVYRCVIHVISVKKPKCTCAKGVRRTAPEDAEWCGWGELVQQTFCENKYINWRHTGTLSAAVFG